MTTPLTPPNGREFTGWGRPKYTQIPNLFLDEWMQDLSHSETRALLYIFRRTFGYHEDGAPILQRHFLEGWTAGDGRVLDHGAGIVKSSLSIALQGLEEKRLIFRHQQHDPKRGSLPTYYELNMDGVPHCTEHCTNQCTPPPKSGNPPPPKFSTPPPPKFSTPPPTEVRGGLTIEERKNVKERSVKETDPPPTPATVPPNAPPHAVVVVETTKGCGQTTATTDEAEERAAAAYAAFQTTPTAPAAAASPGVEADIALLLTGKPGLTRPQAQELALAAQDRAAEFAENLDGLTAYGYDAATVRKLALLALRQERGYVAASIGYVQQSPGLRNPKAVLHGNIVNNEIRREAQRPRSYPLPSEQEADPAPADLAPSTPPAADAAADPGDDGKLQTTWRIILRLLRMSNLSPAQLGLLPHLQLVALDLAARQADLQVSRGIAPAAIGASGLLDRLTITLAQVCHTPLTLTLNTPQAARDEVAPPSLTERHTNPPTALQTSLVPLRAVGGR